MPDPRVTVVVSTKDQFARIPLTLRALRETAPGMPVILVLSGPRGESTSRAIREEAARHPSLEILEAGDFAGPFSQRNLAIPRVRTPLTMFLYGDIRPRPGWLEVLLRAADEHPEAAVFQPLIWERDGELHAMWSDLFFVDDGTGPRLVHPYVERRERPAEGPQPWFLEDHAILARTELLESGPFFDPGVCFTREFLDLALTLRRRGAEILSVPSAEVDFGMPTALDPEDLLWFAYRRCEEAAAGAAERLRRKWGIEAHYDGIGRRFFREFMEGVTWSDASVPADPGLQRRMALAFFVAAGFNRFDGRTLRDFFPGFDRGGGGELELDRSTEIPLEADALPDDPAAREALRRGELFPVVALPDRLENMPGRGIYFRPFLLGEAGGLRGTDAEVLEAWAPRSSLIWREEDGSARAFVYRPWWPIHRAAADAVQSRAEPGLRWHRAEESGALPLRVRLGGPGWRLLHWSWKSEPLKV